MLILATVKFKSASIAHPQTEEVLLYTWECVKCSDLIHVVIVHVAVSGPFLVGGTQSSGKSQQEGCYSGCVRQILGILSSSQAVTFS